MKKRAKGILLSLTMILTLVPFYILQVNADDGVTNKSRQLKDVYSSGDSSDLQSDRHMESSTNTDTPPSITELHMEALMQTNHAVSAPVLGAILSSGYCGGEGDGTNLVWEIDDTGTLTITGNGTMANYDWENPAPWYSKRNDILSIHVQSGVKSIGDDAFSNYYNLTNVSLPNGLLDIGNYAFESCVELSSIEIPNTVVRIGSQSFFQCTNLEILLIPDSVTRIERYAFGKCFKLKSVEISKNLNYMEGNVFSECSSLTNISVSNENGAYTSNDGVLFDKGKTTLIAYPGGRKGEYTIPKGVQVIGKGAFSWCYNLSKVTIPTSVKTIGNTAFGYCSSLSSISIPKSVQSIGFSAFSNCAFTEVVIPEGVSKIDDTTFEYCGNLQRITIPQSVKTIGWGAFTGCSKLTDVYYSGTEDQWKSIAIDHGENGRLLSATIHLMNPTPAQIKQNVTYNTTSHTYTSTSNPNQKVIEFDAGADLYKNGKTRTEMSLYWNFFEFKESAQGYSKSLATVAAVLSGNAYNKGLVWDTLDTLGFKNIQQENYEIGQENAELGDWLSDTVGYNIAYADCKINMQPTTVVAIVCRGSAGTFLLSKEWKSNIYQMEWGFSAAADNLYSDIETYLKDIRERQSTPHAVKFLITGHSRGGAVANLLGKKLSDKYQKQNVFVYTFASPTTTTAADRHEYNNIKNYVNKQDAVPALPGWMSILHFNAMWSGCNRYGLELPFNKSDTSGFDAYLSALTDGSVASDVDSVIKEHSIGVYAAYVMSYDFGPPQKYTTKVLSVKCPVDVDVYDEDGQLLGSIRDNQPDDSLASNAVFVVINGDEKYIYTTSERNLRLEFTGTDIGEMTYSVEELDMATGDTVSQGVITNVALTNGKSMTSTVAGDIAAADTQLFVKTDDSVTAMVGSDGTEAEVVMISFDTGEGEPVRNMPVVKGRTAGTLPSAVYEGQVFTGWYTDATLTTPFDTAAPVTEAMTLYAAYAPAYDLYGLFNSVAYDGAELAAELTYCYNDAPSQMFAALYKDGQMLSLQQAEIAQGKDSVKIAFQVSGLAGYYELKAFSLDAQGNFTPISTSAAISFVAN